MTFVGPFVARSRQVPYASGGQARMYRNQDLPGAGDRRTISPKVRQDRPRGAPRRRPWPLIAWRPSNGGAPMSRSFNVRNVMFLVLVSGAVAAAGCGHGWKVVRDGGPVAAEGRRSDHRVVRLLAADRRGQVREGLRRGEEGREDGLRDQLERAEEAAGDQLRDRHGAEASGGRRPRAGRSDRRSRRRLPDQLHDGPLHGRRVDEHLDHRRGGVLRERAARGCDRHRRRGAATIYRPTVFAHVPPVATDLGKATGKFVESKNK